MTDLELLFLVLAIIYVWECGWWAQRGSVGFRTWLGKRWRIVQPSKLLGNQQAGLVFAHPLPPLGTFLIGNTPFLSLSSEGVLAYVPPSVETARRRPQTGNFVRFDQIKNVSARGKKVRINGRLFAYTSSATLASLSVKHLEALRQTVPVERQKAIAKLVEQPFETKTLEQLLARFGALTQNLRLFTNLLFFYLFAIAPAMIWRFGLGLTWSWLLAGLLALTSTIALIFRRGHRALYPEAEDERFTHFLIVLLSPASAVRAHDLLARPLLERFHPLTVAQVLCTKPDSTILAEQFLRELCYPALPLCPLKDPVAVEAERFARELAKSSLEKHLRRHGLNPECLLSIPARGDNTCESFCPRCHAQFTVITGVCQDCGGVALKPFAKEAAVPSPKAPGRKPAISP